MTYVREKHSETTLKSSFHNNNMQLKAIGENSHEKKRNSFLVGQ